MIPSGARRWRKSSYSGGQGGACVEVGPDSTTVGVRDTKAPDAGQLTVGPSTWSRFVTAVATQAITPR